MPTPSSDVDVFVFPASFAQQRLWFLNAIDPGSPVYNVPVALRLRGVLDEAALRGALGSLVARHEALRTSFSAGKEGEIHQVVHPEVDTPLRCVDLSALPAPARDDEAMRLVTVEGGTAFDLEVSPLIRFLLLKLSQDEHILVLNVHHIVADGWSLSVLYRELNHFYKGHKSSLPTELPAPLLQYADYAIWQREWVNTPACEAQLTFWKNVFSGGPTLLELPRDMARPGFRRSHGAKVAFEIPPAVVAAIGDICRKENATPFMLLLSAFQVLLGRYSGQDNVTVGCPFANRGRPELESSVGFYTSTIPIRTDLSGDPEFREVLGRVRSFSLQALSNQDVPYERIVEAVNPQRDLSHNPLFQVMFAMQKSPEAELALVGLAVEPLEVDNGTAKFDLLMEVQESPRRWQGYIEYDSQIFLPGTIQRLVKNFLALLATATRTPQARVSELDPLDAAERMTILETWNETQVEYQKHSSVVEFFDQAARKHPDAIAVLHGESSLTYKELEHRSDKLANLLAKRGAQPGGCVGLACRRSSEMIVGVLGILKAGCAYVPIDPEYPRDRIKYMVSDAGINIVLAQDETRAIVPTDRVQIVNLDDVSLWTEECPRESTTRPISPSDLAYVIYTSGSTGVPKGVAMPHAPLVNLIHWQLQHTTLGQGARTLQFSSISFDVSFQEIFATLASGGALVLIDEATRKNPLDLLRHLCAQRVERIFLPYIALQQLAEAAQQSTVPPPGLREVITAGEQLHVTPEIRSFFTSMPECRLHNHYGPTESHVVTAHEVCGPVQDWPGLPPIGRPIANARIYIVDSSLKPVPVGVPGELMIGGSVLADGYLHRNDLTQARFIPDPFSPRPGARMYRTGDVARFLDDGTIQYLARNDQQVKIRGYRIEPGEVEEALKEVPGVREAVVMAQGNNSAERHLEAYLLLEPGQELSVGRIRESLRDGLPDYMLPSVYFAIPRLPLTPSGKIDRRAVAALPGARRLEGEAQHVAARDDVERSLVKIWEDVLKHNPVGVTDNFFEVGGTSILAVRVFARIAKVFGVEIPLAMLFKAPNIESLARVVRERQGTQSSSSLVATAGTIATSRWRSLVPIRATGSRLPIFAVHAGGGHVLFYRPLAEHLGQEQPFYALQAPAGLTGSEPPFGSYATIEQLAELYVREIREVQPHGPYILAGSCAGGPIALEIAQRLRNLGEPVEPILLFDSWLMNSGASGGARLAIHRKAMSELDARGRIGYVTHRIKSTVYYRIVQSWYACTHGLRAMAARLGGVVRRTRGLSQVQDSIDFLFRETSLQLVARYVPRPYDGSVVLFRSATFKANPTLPSELVETMGWGSVVRGGLVTLDLPGDHLAMLEEPLVGEVTRLVRERLSTIRTTPGPSLPRER